MEQLSLGLKIKQLRKERKLTQEMLAGALGVTPQAVSKWEMNLTYPDITLIPVIANYFEVSLDTLFDFDPSKKKEKIKAIIAEANELLFDNTKACIEKIKLALVEYPENEKLLDYLLECYEYDLRSHGCRDGIESMLDISQKLINESIDHEIVVRAKIIRSAALLAIDKYTEAKAMLQTLPQYCRDDEMAFRLKGTDKLNAAVNGECVYLQALYIALMNEGEAAYELGQYIRAERCFGNIPRLIELFTYSEEKGKCLYWWDGMQTFHSFACLGLAASKKKLGKEDEAKVTEEKAYQIISTAWPDFEQRKAYYMQPFADYAKKFDEKS